MHRLFGFVVFTLVWLAGCLVFDSLLELPGAWLMLGGFITGDIARACRDWYERSAEAVCK